METDAEDGSAAEKAAESEFEVQDEQGDSETDSAAARWWLTNDVLAGGMFAVSAVLVLGASAGRLDLSTIPSEWATAWVVAFLVSIAWSFGDAFGRALKAYRS